MPDDENRPDDRSEDDPEGIRILGADEAADALEREDVARRRSPDEPRYGDRPARRPDDAPEPVLRFPLSASEGEPTGDLPHWTEPPAGQHDLGGPTIFDEADPTDARDWGASPRWREEADWSEEVSAFADDEPAGALADDDRPDPEDFFRFDDLDPAPAPSRSVFDPPGQSPLDPDADADAGDMHEGAVPRRIVVGGGRLATGAPEGAGGMGAGVGTDRDLGQAVVVGVGFLLVAAVLFALGPVTAAVLATVVVTFAAAELFTKLREVGYQPASLLGVVATAGLMVGVYNRGEIAIPVVVVLTVVFALLWYLAGVGEGQAVLNIGVTVFGVAWVGVLGSFAAALLSVQGGPGVGDAGKGILFGAILGTIGYDVGGYFVGRSAGRSPLSTASPNKTIEGLLGGCIAAVTVCVIYGFLTEPFNSLGDGLLLGLAVAVAAPLGDLTQSLVKRDLGIKDMGSVLPGHGGLLDRFDALLFVLPAVYYTAKLSDFFL